MMKSSDEVAATGGDASDLKGLIVRLGPFAILFDL
jgi:hypothetical protein